MHGDAFEVERDRLVALERRGERVAGEGDAGAVVGVLAFLAPADDQTGQARDGLGAVEFARVRGGGAVGGADADGGVLPADEGEGGLVGGLADDVGFSLGGDGLGGAFLQGREEFGGDLPAAFELLGLVAFEAGAGDAVGGAVDGVEDALLALSVLLRGDPEGVLDAAFHRLDVPLVDGEEAGDDALALGLGEYGPGLGVGAAGVAAGAVGGPLAGEDGEVDGDLVVGAVLGEDPALAVEDAAADGGDPAFAGEAAFGLGECFVGLADAESDHLGGHGGRGGEEGEHEEGEASAEGCAWGECSWHVWPSVCRVPPGPVRRAPSERPRRGRAPPGTRSRHGMDRRGGGGELRKGDRARRASEEPL